MYQQICGIQNGLLLKLHVKLYYKVKDQTFKITAIMYESILQ